MQCLCADFTAAAISPGAAAVSSAFLARWALAFEAFSNSRTAGEHLSGCRPAGMTMMAVEAEFQIVAWP